MKEKLYLKGKLYRGEVAPINGYNGYTATKDHGKLCAIVNGSAWDTNGKANVLYTKDGRAAYDKNSPALLPLTQ